MPNTRWAYPVLLFTLFLVMVGFGIIIPVLPFLVLSASGDAATLGLLMATYSVTQFFFAPLWGRLSDRIGRRPVLLIGLAGYGLSFIAFGLATELWMLFATRLISGVLSSATLPTTIAFIADITTPEERSRGMGLLGAAAGLGMIFGPAIGGWLGHFGLAMPFFVAGGLGLTTVPFAYFLLPESLKVFTTRAEQKNSPLWRGIRTNPQLPLYTLAFVVSFSMALFESTFSLFAALRIGLGPKELGIVFTILGALGVIMQAGLIDKLSTQFGEVKLILTGVIFSAVGLLLIVAASNMALMIVFTAIFSIGSSLLRPSLSTLISKNATAGQGTSAGLMQSFDSLGRIFGPVAGGFSFNLHPFSPNILGAAILLVILMYFWPRLGHFQQ